MPTLPVAWELSPYEILKVDPFNGLNVADLVGS